MKLAMYNVKETYLNPVPENPPSNMLCLRYTGIINRADWIRSLRTNIGGPRLKGKLTASHYENNQLTGIDHWVISKSINLKIVCPLQLSKLLAY
jgi:hypothetical protein